MNFRTEHLPLVCVALVTPKTHARFDALANTETLKPVDLPVKSVCKLHAKREIFYFNCGVDLSDVLTNWLFSVRLRWNVTILLVKMARLANASSLFYFPVST